MERMLYTRKDELEIILTILIILLIIIMTVVLMIRTIIMMIIDCIKIMMMTYQTTHQLLYLPSYVAAGVLLFEVIHSLSRFTNY